MTDDHLISAIRTVIACEQSLADIDEQRKIAYSNHVAAEQAAIEAFVDSGATDVTVDGRRWKPSFDTKLAIDYPDDASDEAKAVIAAKVVEWIKENGGQDLVKPAMHHSRRDSFLRQKLIDDEGVAHIPEELASLVKAVDLPKLGSRKVK